MTMSSSVAEKVPFQDLCLLFAKVASTSGKDAKAQLLKSFVEHWRQLHAEMHADDETTDDSFHPAMRLILPHVDRQRLAYGMKEVLLAKFYIDVLGIAKESDDAQKLLKYRAPRTARQEAGDFASVAYYVLKNRCPETGSLTIADVNKDLDDLSLCNSKRDREGMKRAMMHLLRNLSAVEQKWLIRIVLKDMKMGMSETSVFRVYHQDALDLHNACTNLEKVCKDLRDPSVRLVENEIALFQPFRPMLASRVSISQVTRLMDHKEFFMETKYDGDRMQLHKDGEKYLYYSRSSKDYTSSFGACPTEGTFTPVIHSTFSSKVTSCILDGEMVGYDPVTECFMPKGENIDVKSLGAGMGKKGGSTAHQCFVVFDVLMVNGKNLGTAPYHQRISHLPQIFEPLVGRMMISKTQKASTKEEIIAALNDAIDKREEGLMIKHPDSTYRPDKRKGSGWLKIKPEYIDSLSDQLDLVIIGGYYGRGRRRGGMISHFLCGIAVPSDNPSDHPSVFYSFCKVGTGYTIEELKQLGRKLEPYWKPFDTNRPPSSVILAPGFKEKPDVWIEPSDSQIVQIKAAEIIVTDKFKANFTLRFPRLERIRDDKRWYECMNLDELNRARLTAQGRLTHRHFDDDGEDGGTPKNKRKVAIRPVRQRAVAAQFRPADVSSVSQVSKMFEGVEFCIVNGCPGQKTKAELEKAVVEHGASFVQAPGVNTRYVIANKMTMKVKNIISADVYDVVKAEWLISCLNAKKRVILTPLHMHHKSPSTAAQFDIDFDEFGDSFTHDVDERQLKATMAIMPSVDMDPSEIGRLDERYFPEATEEGLFRRLKFYLDKNAIVGDSLTSFSSPLELVGLHLRYYGGTVPELLTDDVTHVVFDSNDLSRLSDIRALARQRARKFHCVKSDWVAYCIGQRALRNERPFEP
ncbi:DNA ligase 4-like [Oscarella lobularis]|uniref:DNA ligase 4-like n=1 Tax=Oscarella lobularis TaxID=121494 RepID=UPI00331400B4